MEKVRSRLKQFFKAFAIWTSLCAYYYLLHLPSMIRSNRMALYWDSELFWALVQFYIWGLLFPFIKALVYRYPLSRQRLLRSLLFYLPLGLLVHLIYTFIYVSVYWILGGVWTPPPSDYLDGLRAMLVVSFRLHIIFYFSIVAYIQANVFYQTYNFERLKAAKLEASLAKAELQNLKTQLHPHFLFNTLNAVSALVGSDPQAANRTIAQLSSLLRLSLKSGKTEVVPLKNELDFLRKYIQIQQTLLQERLQVQWNISTKVLDAQVPNMILQTLVENSIRHGIAPKNDDGRIEIIATRENKTLRLLVKDNGMGLALGAESNGGLGLANTRARLKHLYGEEHEFSLEDSPGGGVTVSLRIPFREAATNDEDSDFNS